MAGVIMQKINYIFVIIIISLLLNSCKWKTQPLISENSPLTDQAQRNADSSIEGNTSPNCFEIIINDVVLPKGQINIPGYAFIDGRDLKAIHPYTIVKINIWDSQFRKNVVCEIPHGTQVKILKAIYVSQEGKCYLNVQFKNYNGWVSESFISSKKMETVGDLF